ncbi:MAG: glycerophosphoryl diester phosphodiesterase membrane domain-containing protein [Ruminococcus sp.]|nr:glycerophosphoryl diester phosphodiesterase membrane domain-containing protein [Ruminococcus sp.]
MKNFFRSMGVFLKAMPHFLVFELIFRLLLLAVGAPVLVGLIKITMKASHINYLSDEHLAVYLKHPVTILALLVLLFILAFFSFVELSALAACFSCCSQKKRITAGVMLRTGTAAFRKAFRRTGVLRFMLFMLFMPLAQFTLSSGAFMAPMLPVLRRALSDLGSGTVMAVYILVQIMFVLLIATKSYSLHFLVLTDSSFPESVKKSLRLLKGKRLKMALGLFLWSLFIVAVLAAAIFGITFVIVLFKKGVSRPHKALVSALRILRYAGQIFVAASSFISAPAIMCWLTGRFFADTENSEKIILPVERDTFGLSRPTRIAIVSLVTVLSLLLNRSYLKALYKGNINLNVGILTHTQITAHRGFSKVAPENTLYAFEAALDSGADYIELDVQLTKDEQLVVFHDDTLDRVTDRKGKLRDYTYSELQHISVGEWFKGGDFADARIPLLSEVLDLVGDDIMLNIEIKNNGNMKETVRQTVELIQLYGIDDSCYVTSFSYAALKQVKSLDPSIKTGLIANVATTTAMTQLKYIDAMSMNYIFVNQTVVNAAHQNGKRIFVWTVDRKGDMQQMIALGVDNIITNRPDQVAELVYSRSLSDVILTVVKAVFGT